MTSIYYTILGTYLHTYPPYDRSRGSEDARPVNMMWVVFAGGGKHRMIRLRIEDVLIFWWCAPLPCSAATLKFRSASVL